MAIEAPAAPPPAPAPGTCVVSPADAAARAEWDAFVQSHPSATGYHQWAWRRIVERAFGHECVYLAAREDGRLAGVLPLVLFDTLLFGRFAVSLPFVNYGGVVATGRGAADALVEAARGVARERRLRHVELRHLEAHDPALPVRRHKVAMRLALPRDRDALWEALDRKVRNQVRKAEKSGLTEEDGGAELLPGFYTVFARNMRDLGTPVYGRRFFEAVLGELPDSARVHIVRRGTLPVAASVTLRWRRTIEVPWAASLREYRSECPNMLLYWSMLQHALAGGCTTFDFGRSSPEAGTYHFKRQWGAEPTPCAWEYLLPPGAPLPDQSPSNPKFRLAIAAWQRLPLPLTTWLGPRIVRSIP